MMRLACETFLLKVKIQFVFSKHKNQQKFQSFLEISFFMVSRLSFEVLPLCGVILESYFHVACRALSAALARVRAAERAAERAREKFLAQREKNQFFFLEKKSR